MIGTFLLDIEVELAWGFIDQQFHKGTMTRASRNVRKHLPAILSLLEKHKTPATWGILGHVALEHCERTPTPHPDMSRPLYKWFKRDWYEQDPCSTMEKEPAFYGKDIVDQVLDFTFKSKASHDIACHSFSHQLFGDPGCTAQVAETEIRKCLEIMKNSYNICPRVFIFPRDYVGHLDALKRHGFIAFRGAIPHTIKYSESPSGTANSLKQSFSIASYGASFYCGIPPPVVRPLNENGLINIPASMCYNKKPYIPLSLVKAKAIKGIKSASRERKIFHLYTHLINFGLAPNMPEYLDSFKEILAFVSSLRDKHVLETTTMRDLAESIVND